LVTTKLTETRLIQFLNEMRHIDSLNTETALFSDGAIDSVGLIALINFVEQVSGIEVGPADVTLENFDTISRILTYVSSQVQQ
jgi:acyl carrier protein